MKSDTEIFKLQTRHASLALNQRADKFELRSNAGALHSAINLQQREKLQLKNLEYLIAILLFIPTPTKILVLGTGAGSLLHFLEHYLPNCELTSVDCDAEMLELMQERGILPAAHAGLSYIVEDAELYLQHCDKQFDLILVDLFIGNQLPGWLSGRQSMQQMRGLLSAAGAVAYNLLFDSDHAARQFSRSLCDIFDQQCLNFPVAGIDNSIAFAFRQAPKTRQMTWYMQQASNLGELHDIDYVEILAEVYNANPAGYAGI